MTLPKKVHTSGGSVPEKGGGDFAPVMVGCSRREDKGGDLLVSCYYIDCGMNEFAILPAQSLVFLLHGCIPTPLQTFISSLKV